MLQFEWDENKGNANKEKHGVRFEEAKVIWTDPFAIELLDPLHSVNEERFVRIGLNPLIGVLLVIYCERKDVIRIISARKANSEERRTYERPLRLI